MVLDAEADEAEDGDQGKGRGEDGGGVASFHRSLVPSIAGAM